MTNLPPIQLPPSNNSKAAGIRGLKQILESARTCTYQERFDLFTRYLARFENRMQKAKTPLTESETLKLLGELLTIIAKSPEEIKAEKEMLCNSKP